MAPEIAARGRRAGRHALLQAGALLFALALWLAPLLARALARPPVVGLAVARSLRLDGAVDGTLAAAGGDLWAVVARPRELAAARRSPAGGWRWAPALSWPAGFPVGRLQGVEALADGRGGLHVLLLTAPVQAAGGPASAPPTVWYARLEAARWRGPERVGRGDLLRWQLLPGTAGSIPVVTLAAGFDAAGRPVERTLVRTRAGWRPGRTAAEVPPPPPQGWQYVWEAAPADGGRAWMELVGREGEDFLEVVRTAGDGRLLADLGRLRAPVATDAPVFRLLEAGSRWWVIYTDTVGRPLSAGGPQLRFSEELRLYAPPARPGAGQEWPLAAAFETGRAPLPGLALAPGGSRALAGTADGRLFLLWRPAPDGTGAGAGLWLTELDPQPR